MAGFASFQGFKHDRLVSQVNALRRQVQRLRNPATRLKERQAEGPAQGVRLIFRHPQEGAAFAAVQILPIALPVKHVSPLLANV